MKSDKEATLGFCGRCLLWESTAIYGENCSPFKLPELYSIRYCVTFRELLLATANSGQDALRREPLGIDRTTHSRTVGGRKLLVDAGLMGGGEGGAPAATFNRPPLPTRHNLQSHLRCTGSCTATPLNNIRATTKLLRLIPLALYLPSPSAFLPQCLSYVSISAHFYPYSTVMNNAHRHYLFPVCMPSCTGLRSGS